MALTTDQIFLLNTKLGKAASDVQLGTLLNSAFTIAASEITLANGKILVGNASNVGAAQTMSGDATLSNAGALTIANGAVTGAKMAALTSGQILVGNGSNVATAVAVSGDAALSNAGALTIGANAVGLSKVGTDVLAEATGTLTQANLTGMNGAAVQLIAAPGSGKLLVPVEFEFFHSYSTAAYTGGGVVQLQLGTTTFMEFAASLVTNAGSQTWWQRPSCFDLDASTGTGKGLQVDTLANAALNITNATGAFTAGNVANVLKWRCRYRVITLLT